MKSHNYLIASDDVGAQNLHSVNLLNLSNPILPLLFLIMKIMSPAGGTHIFYSNLNMHTELLHASAYIRGTDTFTY